MTTALRDYFTPEGQARALKAYVVFADNSAWSVAHKMDLYDAGRTAFSSATEPSIAFRSFESVYANLAGPGWQVFRPFGVTRCWNARQVYDSIRSGFAGYSCADVTLLSLPSDQHALRQALESLRAIKPKSTYPTMTVSKFLHFFNPSLFPIYDTEIVENRVFKRFRSDYHAFCTQHQLNPKASGADFLMNYMRWASTLVAGAGPTFMARFVDWLREELPPRRFAALDPAHLARLYSTAFEFTAIGAATAGTH